MGTIALAQCVYRFAREKKRMRREPVTEEETATVSLKVVPVVTGRSPTLEIKRQQMDGYGYRDGWKITAKLVVKRKKDILVQARNG
ncbi:hypothetical protein RUM43_002108 [Polyplax serrata]|uniref:Uncharacterized protein n=1 Tax=Polyplax serrata TaxID=468196 RepID=A0AAN8S953_POLSC